MGASNSRLEEDEAVQLCRARYKFIKQALNGRCSLASAHIAYIQHLGTLGSAFSGAIEPECDLVEKPTDLPSGVSESSDERGNMLPPSSPNVISSFQSSAMRFGGVITAKVEEKLPVVAAVASREPDEVIPAWDYFGLFQRMDGRFSSQEWMGLGSEEEMRQLEEEEGMPELEEVDEKQSSSHGMEEKESQESEDEFKDEPPSASLVRNFKSVNRDSETGFSGSHNNVEETGVDMANEKKDYDSHVSSPLRDVSPRSLRTNGAHIEGTEECGVEDTVQPKGFFSSIKDIQQLFVEASESGKEVPQMLEANKFHFHPVKERGSMTMTTSSFLKSCFSCGKDLGEVQQEASKNTVKYLTWHQKRSSCSSSSQNPILTNSTDYTNELNGNLFDNFCMVSGSHASTLDRLFAWEKKLYDEVKAGKAFRANFDQKCKILRQKESRGESAEKTRAAVKDLHSRIRVAIHRINSISKKIEEIRDLELQPQLEELIEGLRKMWETMARCHKHQFHILSISHIPGAMKIKTQPGAVLHLINKLNALSSALTKWITAQKAYVEAIDRWLFKCVALPQNPTKRNKRMNPPRIRNCGPPIYMMCGAWLEMIDQLPVKGTIESLDVLATEVARITPTNQDKGPGSYGNNAGQQEHHQLTNLDPFRTALAGVVGQLDKFAESCVDRFVELQKGIQEAKWNYQRFQSQRGFRVLG